MPLACEWTRRYAFWMSGTQRYLRPVFIGGCDRSGTTLLGATLARFPGVVTLPESQFIHQTARMHGEDNKPLADLADYISTHLRFDAWRQAGCAPPQERLKPQQDYRDFMDALIRDYARATGVENPAVFVDHSPDNRCNIRILKRFFPDLKFAHMIRDGRAVAASLMPQDWGPNDILEAAQVWMTNVAAGFAAKDYLGDAAHNLRFEALVEEDRATLNTVALLAGAASFDAARETTSFCVPSYAGSTHKLVKMKPLRDRVSAWRRGLSARKIELFEYYAGELLDALGYERVFSRGAARKANRMERAAIMVKRWVCYRRNYWRMRARFGA